jgi:hypothetical protein
MRALSFAEVFEAEVTQYYLEAVSGAEAFG